MTLTQILLGAADVIDKRGWYQGGYVPSAEANDIDLDNCPVCVLAAINVATGHLADDDFSENWDSDGYDAALALADHLGLIEDAYEDGVIDTIGCGWNDYPERTAEQVTTALRQCAANLPGGAA